MTGTRTSNRRMAEAVTSPGTNRVLSPEDWSPAGRRGERKCRR